MEQGKRQNSTARLEESVTAFRTSLNAITREQQPSIWAATQDYLGAALVALGQRESGTARLEDGVAALRAVLDEAGRETAPIQLAGVQCDLGAALMVLGERESGTTHLKEAVTEYDAALTALAQAQVSPDSSPCKALRDRATALLATRKE